MIMKGKSNMGITVHTSLNKVSEEIIITPTLIYPGIDSSNNFTSYEYVIGT